MIRGDGLLNIVRAFNNAIAGLSDRDTATYAQAFMCERAMSGLNP